MDLLSTIFLLISLGLMGYMFINRNKLNVQSSPTAENSKAIEEEIIRKNEIIKKVDDFLKDSQFFEPIAKLNDEPIYNYVFNEGYLYKFEEIMPATNQRIGIDDDQLCFKKLYYKRVNDPVEFISLFSDNFNKANDDQH